MSTSICTVKLARHKVTGQRVAIKVINKKKLKESKQTQYYDEARLLIACRHSNIIRHVESFQTTELVFIATEYQPGGDLVDHMNKHWDKQNLSEEAVKPLARGIASGLKYLHKHNIIHRDIKPENVVLSRDSPKDTEPQIVDFGFAQKLDEDGICTGVVGTLPFTAPEILQRKPYSFSSDVWSYGCLVYGLITGDHPMLTATVNSSDEMREVFRKAEIRFDQPVWKKVTAECRDFIRQLLVIEP